MIPVPLRNLTEGHAYLLCDAYLRCVVPIGVLFKVVKQSLDLLRVLAHPPSILYVVKVFLIEHHTCLKQCCIILQVEIKCGFLSVRLVHCLVAQHEGLAAELFLNIIPVLILSLSLAITSNIRSLFADSLVIAPGSDPCTYLISINIYSFLIE